MLHTMFGSVSLSYHNNGGGAIKVLMHRHIPRADPREDKLRIIEVTDRGKIKEYSLQPAKSVKLAPRAATVCVGTFANLQVFEKCSYIIELFAKHRTKQSS